MASCFILEDVLHFYTDDQIAAYLNRLIDIMQDASILVVIVNHTRNEQITKADGIKCKSKYHYYHSQMEPEDYFLFDKERIDKLFNNFNLIEEYSDFSHPLSFELYFRK